MNRRGFLKSILAAGVAPYVVTTAGVLMPVRQTVPASKVFPYADGGYEPFGERGYIRAFVYDRAVVLNNAGYAVVERGE